MGFWDGFWSVWDTKIDDKKKEEKVREERGGTTQLSILALRGYLYKGRRLSALGCILASRDPPDLDFWWFVDAPGWVLDNFGDIFCMLCAARRPALHNAFIEAVPVFLHLLVLLLLLFWCGGLCAALGIFFSPSLSHKFFQNRSQN